MIVLVALAVGLVFWITGWALGLGAFDCFMVTLALVLGAYTVRQLAPFIRSQLGGD
jgi:hypothetical protein